MCLNRYVVAIVLDWLDWDRYTKVCVSFTSMLCLSSVRSIGLQLHINNIAPVLQWRMIILQVTGNIAETGGGINLYAVTATASTMLTITGSTVAIVV